jgi:hypothetical protein
MFADHARSEAEQLNKWADEIEAAARGIFLEGETDRR